jgi:hypothetical protein|nr:MAG TPA: Protein of unknown function (DUF1398) [Caudoviricetes sp.]
MDTELKQRGIKTALKTLGESRHMFKIVKSPTPGEYQTIAADFNEEALKNLYKVPKYLHRSYRMIVAGIAHWLADLEDDWCLLEESEDACWSRIIYAASARLRS